MDTKVKSEETHFKREVLHPVCKGVEVGLEATMGVG